MGNEFIEFMNALLRRYLEQCDTENVLASIDKNVSWIGTGQHEIGKGLAEAAEVLQLEEKEYSDGFNMIDSWSETTMISKDICVVYGEFWATAKDASAGVADLHHRLSAVCRKTESGITLLHFHLSTPDDDQQCGEDYVKSERKTDKQTLRLQYAKTAKDLRDRNQELDMLTANIPGGVHQCKKDKRLTLIHMSNGFFSMFGYTREEIESIFKNSFMNMIYEGDKENIVATMEEQLKVGTTVEIEYRVVCKNGGLMWVLDRGKLATSEDGSESFFCMMMDITKRKAEDEKLRLALERHKVIMDQATDIIFEWDIKADAMDYSSNWEKQFGYAPITQNISTSIPMSDDIYSDDIPAFVKLMQNVVAGVPYLETEFRVKNKNGEYTWCRIRETTQFDSEGKPIKAVGVIVNIKEEKSRSNLLLEAAQCDALTHLYNKSVTKSKIQKIFDASGSESLHALMIIDIDNFKSVNDRFGHHCGDAALSNMGKALKQLFRSADVVGRIGGDEFLVLMSDIASKEIAAAKAKEIVDIFGDMPTEIGGKISCSVGVAMYPADGADYDTLFLCADIALYGVKRRGKVNFAFYDKNSSGCVSYAERQTAINEKIGLDENGAVNQELVRRVYHFLKDASDIDAAVNDVLEVVGKGYSVSRAYVFETSEDGKTCSNTFEWCNDGIEPQLPLLQNLSFETDLAGFFDIYDENGVFYCQDIESLNPQLRSVLEKQHVVSVLQCFIKDGSVFKGYIGFDECVKNRYWTKEQVDTLSTVANILSSSLMKQRTKERSQKQKI